MLKSDLYSSLDCYVILQTIILTSKYVSFSKKFCINSEKGEHNFSLFCLWDDCWFSIPCMFLLCQFHVQIQHPKMLGTKSTLYFRFLKLFNIYIYMLKYLGDACFICFTMKYLGMHVSFVLQYILYIEPEDNFMYYF